MHQPDLLERLERTCADFFWAPSVRCVDRPELGYAVSPIDAMVFNTCYRVRPEGHDAQALVDEVVHAHEGRGSRWAVTELGDAARLRSALKGAGYTMTHRHLGMIASTAEPFAASKVRVTEVGTLAELQALERVQQAVFGKAPTAPEQLKRDLETCTGPERRVARFIAWIDDTPVASGGLTLHPALSLVFMWAGGTLEHARGQGAYRALVEARREFAHRAGFDFMGLFAREHTSAPIVRRLGFRSCGEMHYWDREA